MLFIGAGLQLQDDKGLPEEESLQSTSENMCHKVKSIAGFGSGLGQKSANCAHARFRNCAQRILQIAQIDKSRATQTSSACTQGRI